MSAKQVRLSGLRQFSSLSIRAKRKALSILMSSAMILGIVAIPLPSPADTITVTVTVTISWKSTIKWVGKKKSSGYFGCISISIS